jgi:protoheme IX farnesyltransferase
MYQMAKKAGVYYSLTKPRVLYGNVLTTVAGFLYASRGSIDWLLFAAVCAGTTLIIAAACVTNNYLDQDIDVKMDRTKKRAIVAGEIPGWHAIVFALVLGITGLGILVAYTNTIVAVLGVIGFVDYVVLYGMWSKRLSIHGTLVGSISGAIPILAGYVGAAGVIDVAAIILFAVLFLWQMPEFYSIAIYRKKEYAAAKVPVISVVRGVWSTTVQIFVYTVAFVVATLALAVWGGASLTYGIVMLLLGAYWIRLGAEGLQRKGDDMWARQMFRYSLSMISIDNLLR